LSKAEEEIAQKKRTLLAVQNSIKPLVQQVLSTLKDENVDFATFCRIFIKTQQSETVGPMLQIIDAAMRKPEMIRIRYNGGK